ncbi:hypothetical protein CJF30_00007194 [Rutstroemia sp. NJR-2017a BBW]|nr:hypothetical protein CJF30_00007194 [Rutstroemia sp. NJR-2017a BBW]
MPQDVQIHKLTTTPLTTLCPVMFSPGFKKVSIAHNARYFPRITHCFTHFARYAQSPTLLEKLAHLANLTPEFLDDTATKINLKSGSERRLAAVIQSRIWKMMHSTVYSPSAPSRAMKTSPGSAIAIEAKDDYHGLLDSVDSSDEPKHRTLEDEFELMISDEERDKASEFDCLLSNSTGGSLRDEFDDLLGNDDEEEMLLSDSYKERFDIESEMDEIWFGRSWQFEGREEDDGSSLADRDWHDEVMLLGDDCATRNSSSFMCDDMLL